MTLIRARGKMIFATPLTTTNNMAATIAVDDEVPEFTSSVIFNREASFPKLTGSINVQGTLTPTLHLFANNTVSFDMASPVAGSKPVSLKAVASVEPMVIVAASPGRAGVPLFGNLFRGRSRDQDKNELLIFITPTIQPEATAPKSNHAMNGTANRPSAKKSRFAGL